MKIKSKSKEKGCDTCSFLKKHFYVIIIATLLLSCIFLALSILMGMSNSNLNSELESNNIKNSPSPNTNSAQTKEYFSENPSSIELPIIMYHAFIEDSSKQNKYFISPKHLEDDLKYLNEHGYTAITMSELIDYVHGYGHLPKKPIILTFDDGYYNNYFYVYPLLREYKQKGVISIIGNQTDLFSLLKEENLYYSHVTWSQLNEMLLSGYVEVQNHTYDLHSMDAGRQGCTELKTESFEEYQEFLMADLNKLQDKIKDYTGFTPNTFTYPFGQFSQYSEQVIKSMGFKASLTCAEKMNHIQKNPDCLYKLGRFLRPPDISSKDFFERVLSN